jgi:hypothetical protein
VYNNKTEFSTPLSKSYRCAKEQSFGLIQNGTNQTAGTIELSHVQLEAFHKKMDDLFSAGWYLIMYPIQSVPIVKVLIHSIWKVYYSKTWLIQNSSDQIRTFFEL